MGELQTVWGVLPSAYLFLAGVAAGTFFVSAVALLAAPQRYGRVANRGFLGALVLLGVGLLCLVAETEKPLRALLLPISFTNAGSWMTIGAWLLLATTAVYAAAGALSLPRLWRAGTAGSVGSDGLAGGVSRAARSSRLLRAGAEGVAGSDNPIGGVSRAVRVFAALGAVLSVGVAAYSAVLLMAAGSVPLWNNPVLVAVFLASAASMGVAVVSALVRCSGLREPSVLRVALVAAPLVELAAVAAFLATSSAGDATQQHSFNLIVTGTLAAAFWVGAIAVGIAAPTVLALAEILIGRLRPAAMQESSDRNERAGSGSGSGSARMVGIVSCACSLMGAFALRSVIVAAGVHASLTVPIAAAAAVGLTL